MTHIRTKAAILTVAVLLASCAGVDDRYAGGPGETQVAQETAPTAAPESAIVLAEPPESIAPPPPPPPPVASAEERIVVTGGRIARPDLSSNSPTVTVDEEFLRQSSTAAVEQQLNKLPQFAVAQSSTASNSCTILDQRRDLSACRDFADPTARGASGRAAAQLADGLSLAWQGELDRAIDAFDQAIRAAPDLSIAYLNRGLAYQSKGDLRRALADLNRAVARDPNGARGYYHRSVIHRARGDTTRADADAKRAIELDSRYQALLP